MPAGIPSLSIVVEWENAGRTGADRARTMLEVLRGQLESRPGQVEIIFVCGDAGLAGEAERAAEAAGAWAARLQCLTVETGDYYEQKNRGAEAAAGELLLFLDSDVVPDAGWLGAILEPFEDPAVDVAGGVVGVAATGLYSKAMALGWFFAPPAGGALAASPSFFANNVAFRRAAFEPFPDSGQYRGQCLILAARLREAGRTIVVNPAARVEHPAPDGLGAFLLRGLWDGHDAAVAVRRSGRTPWVRGTGAMAKLALGRSARVWRGRSTVGLGAAGGLAAIAVALGYHALAIAGVTAAALAPDATRRALRRWDGARKPPA